MQSYAAITSAHILKLLMYILLSGVFFSKLSEIIHSPDVVLFILGGIILGPHVLHLVDMDKYAVGNQLILTIGAAYILYDGGTEIDLKVLNKVKISVTLLSTLGVLISSFITAYFAMNFFHIDFIYALLLGSVIASTDPSILVPLFKTMNIRDKLKQTIISESAFNDAAGAIMTFAVLGIIMTNTFSLNQSIFDLVKTSLGGILIGILVGIIVTLLVSDTTFGIFKQYPSKIALAGVMGAYVISTQFDVSGFMAVFVVGIISGNKNLLGLNLHEDHEAADNHFKEILIMILRILIFTSLGTQVNFTILSKNFSAAILTVIVLIFIARPVSVVLSIISDKRANWSKNEIIYLMWVRETGVIPAALAGMLVTMKVPDADIISSVTFMAIIVTLTFQASTSKYLAKLLKLEQ